MTPEMPNPRRVMVGTYRSETAERAIRWAAGFADRFGADLHVVQVVVPEYTEHGAAERIQAASTAEELAQHAHSIAGERARGRVVVDDDPAMAIVRAAEEDDVDVLIVDNAGMAGRRQFLLRNVPNRISHNARCTVIMLDTFAVGGKAPRDVPIRPSLNPDLQPHRFARGSQIAAVCAKHGLLELFGIPDEEGAVGYRRQARRLRAALEELGPTFVKAGQILSTRPDLLPPEFIEELAELRDHVTPLTEEQVVQVMEQDLGVPWEDVFETIEPEPFAAGTIAQVHRAVLSNGDKVVVKVQRPDARWLIEQDLALLKLFVTAVGARPKVRQRIDLPAAFEHLSTSLHKELDFLSEAKNAERMRGALGTFPNLAVPQVYANLSTSRLLVMQDVGGVAAADIPAGKLRKDAANELLESFYKQILIDGFFHADPHPGNLMWQPEEQRLYFLDLGMVGEVGEKTRELIILLLMALWQNDASFLTEVSLMLSGVNQSDVNMEAFTREMQVLMGKYRGASIKDIQLGPLLQAMIDVSFRYAVPLPTSLTLAAKALAQVQLTASQLDPDIDPLEVAGRFLTRSPAQKLAEGSDPKSLFYRSQKLKLRAVRVFEAVERLAGRPGQKPDVNSRATPLKETMRRAGTRLALGLTAGFSMVASALTSSSEPTGAWAPVAFGLAGAAFMAPLVADFLAVGRPEKSCSGGL